MWCGTYTWARGRFLASLPNQPSVARKRKQDQDDIEQALGLGDDNAGQDESSDSEEESVDAVGMESDPDTEEAPFPEAQGCNEWHCPWRWGLCGGDMNALLGGIVPTLISSVRQFPCSARIIDGRARIQ